MGLFKSSASDVLLFSERKRLDMSSQRLAGQEGEVGPVYEGPWDIQMFIRNNAEKQSPDALASDEYSSIGSDTFGLERLAKHENHKMTKATMDSISE
jgi:hypothetical protein